MSNLKYNYDKEADTLYISIGEPRPSYCKSIDGEMIYARYDFDTHELTGYTIICFQKYLLSGKTNIPIDFDFHKVLQED